jgi:hypothetical protein
MNIEHKPWEWTTEIIEGGGYNLVKADEATRKKQLEEYKKKRKTELLKEINKLKDLL